MAKLGHGGPSAVAAPRDWVCFDGWWWTGKMLSGVVTSQSVSQGWMPTPQSYYLPIAYHNESHDLQGTGLFPGI